MWVYAFNISKGFYILLADVLYFLLAAIPRAQIQLQRSAKKLQEDFEAHLGDGRIVSAFTQLVADKGIL